MVPGIGGDTRHRLQGQSSSPGSVVMSDPAELAKERALGLLREADARGIGPWGRLARESGRDLLLTIPRDQWDAEIGRQFAIACLWLDDVAGYASHVRVEVAGAILSRASTELDLRAEFANFHLAALEASGVTRGVDLRPIDDFFAEHESQVQPVRPLSLVAGIRYQQGDLKAAKGLVSQTAAADRNLAEWAMYSWICLLMGAYDDYLAEMPSESLRALVESVDIASESAASLLNHHRICLHLAGEDRPQDIALWKQLLDCDNIEALAIHAAISHEHGQPAELATSLGRLAQCNEAPSAPVDEFRTSMKLDLRDKVLATRSRQFLDTALSMGRIAGGSGEFDDKDPYAPTPTGDNCGALSSLLKPVVEELSAQGRLELLLLRNSYAGDEFVLFGDGMHSFDALRFYGDYEPPPADDFGQFLALLVQHARYGWATVWPSELQGPVLARARWLDVGRLVEDCWEHLALDLIRGLDLRQVEFPGGIYYLGTSVLTFPGVQLTADGREVLAAGLSSDSQCDVGTQCQFFPPPIASPSAQILSDDSLQSAWRSAIGALTDESKEYLAQILQCCERGAEINRVLTLPEVTSASPEGTVVVNEVASLESVGGARLPAILHENVAVDMLTSGGFDTLHMREPGDAQFLPNGEVEFLLDRHYGFGVVKASRMREVEVDPLLEGLLENQLARLMDLLLTPSLEFRDDYTDDFWRSLRHLASESWRQPLPIPYAEFLAEVTGLTRDAVVGDFSAQPEASLAQWWELLQGPGWRDDSHRAIRIDAFNDTVVPAQLRSWIIGNPWTPSKIIAEGAVSDAAVLRGAAAMNSACPSEVLTRLAVDADQSVRTQTWRNRSSTEQQRAAALLAGIDS